MSEAEQFDPEKFWTIYYRFSWVNPEDYPEYTTIDKEFHFNYDELIVYAQELIDDGHEVLRICEVHEQPLDLYEMGLSIPDKED